MNETMRLTEDFDTTIRHQAKVVSVERITSDKSDEDVRELVLDVDQPTISFEPGQSIGVLAPGSPDFGKEFHFRLYSVADLPESGLSGAPRIKIAVRRCSYIDEINGERYPGIASNYLCDMKSGDTLTITGPYGIPFEIPEERDANLILIGAGTGIAPFRTLIKHMYKNVKDWKGKMVLFHGAKSGLETLYMNDKSDDLANYIDEETFEAIKVLSPRPVWNDPIGWDKAIQEQGEKLWEMLGDARTYVYVAGPEKIQAELDAAFKLIAGSEDKWSRRKAELTAGKRWVELFY
jgi:ferredoxin--NADP+ reductase